MAGIHIKRAGGRFVAMLLAAAALAGPADAGELELGRWWADFGLGYGNMSAPKNSVATSGAGLWVDAQLGGRLNSHWLAGLDIGGIGLHANQHYCNPYDYYCDIYGESLSNVLAVVQYEPKSDHGWFFGAGAGLGLYDNKALDNISGNTDAGSGFTALGRIGYDWQWQPRAHIEAVLSYQWGNIDLSPPFSGHFDYSVIAASVHVAYH
jgi:Lipid A 3-O-deacylase (PagL)